VPADDPLRNVREFLCRHLFLVSVSVPTLIEDTKDRVQDVVSDLFNVRFIGIQTCM
jgi:hypothetical protein